MSEQIQIPSQILEDPNPRRIIDKKKYEKSISSEDGFDRLSPDDKKSALYGTLWVYFNELRGLDEQIPEQNRLINETKSFGEGVLNLIEQKYCKDFSQIQSYNIDPYGVLEIVYKNGKKDHITLLLDSIVLSSEATLRNAVHAQSRISREALSGNYETESYLGGELTVVYEKVVKTAALGYAGASLYTAIRGRNDMILYRIASLVVRTSGGKMIRIGKEGLKETLVDTKENLSRNVGKLIEQVGLSMDPLSGKIGPKALSQIHSLQLDVLRMSYTDFIDLVGKENSESISKNDFEVWKQKLLGEMKAYDAQIGGKTGDEILKGFKEWFIDKKLSFFSEFKDPSTGKMRNVKDIGGLSGKTIISKGINLPIEYIMWGVFFKKYHANMQDSGALYASLGEQALFRLGAQIGGSARFLPGWGRLVTGLGLGAFAVVEGEDVARSMKLDKKFWRYYPDREDEDFKENGKLGKGILGHIISGEATHDIADKVGVDIRIPGTRGGNSVNVGGNTYVDIPDVKFYDTTINFGTNPREYLSASPGRDINTWMNQLSNFEKWVIPEIFKIVDEFREGRGYFSTESIEKKVTINGSIDQKKIHLLDLRLRTLFGVSSSSALMSILNGGGDGKWYEKKGIELATFISLNANIPNTDEMRKRIGWWVIQQIEMMRTTPEQISDRKNLLKAEEIAIEHDMVALSKMIPDIKMRAYFLSIFSRVKGKNRLVGISDNDGEIQLAQKNLKIIEEIPSGAWVKTGVFLGQTGKRWIQSSESRWFTEFLDDKRMEKVNGGIGGIIRSKKQLSLSEAFNLLNDKQEVTTLGGTVIHDAELLNTLGNGFGKTDITFSDAFYALLNRMVNYKREAEFLDNISKTGYSTKWHGPDFLEKSPPKPNGILKAIKDNPLRF